MSAPRTPAAGWYPDPTVPGVKRYWDGKAWTDKTVPGGTGGPVPPSTKPPGSKAGGLTTGLIVGGTVVEDFTGF